MSASSPFERELRRRVERAGGSIRKTKDGHLAVYDARGCFLIKQRSGGTGSTTGRNRERILARIVRAIERSRKGDR